MECKDCKVEMVKGKGIVPVWGTPNARPIQNGNTIISHVDGAYCPVMKCPKCGHSVYEGSMIIRD